MQKNSQQQVRKMGLAQSFAYLNHIPQQKKLQQYILLTYRSGIIPVEKTTYYTSDSGWGCMLRVAQMFIANLIHHKDPQFSIQSIIKLFYDNLMTPFSIQMMTKLSKQLFPHMKQYQWYTPCQAGFLVKHMLQKFDIRYEVRICNDGTMFLDEIKALNQSPNQNINNHHQLEKIQKSKKQQTKQVKQNCDKLDYEERIVILIMARIGLDIPQPGYLKCVTKFMQNKYFLSIMGGTPKHAHLIMQYAEGYFGYLDPHTTRSVIPDYAKTSDYIQQYTSRLQWIKQSKIDSSMCIGFCCLKSQIDEFWQSIKKIKEQMKQSFFIYMDQKRPQFDQNCIIEIPDNFDEQS